MSLVKGKVNFAPFKFNLPPMWESRLAANQGTPAHLENVNDPPDGWVKCDRLLSRGFDADGIKVGGVAHFSLRSIKRRPQAGMVKARLEEAVLRYNKENNCPFCPRKIRAELRAGIVEELTKAAPPAVSGVEVAVDLASKTGFVCNSSPRKVDSVVCKMLGDVGDGFSCSSLSPFKKVMGAAYADGWAGFRGYDGLDDLSDGSDPAADLVLWMWWLSETDGDVFEDVQIGILDGKIKFSGGNHLASVSGASPSCSRIAKDALRDGLVPVSAAFVLARGKEIWKFRLESSNAALRGVELPDSEDLDDASMFVDRIQASVELVGFLDKLADKFVASWKDGETARKVFDWAKGVG